MLNPPRPPDPKPAQIVKGLKALVAGQSFAIGIVVGIVLSWVARLLP